MSRYVYGGTDRAVLLHVCSHQSARVDCVLRLLYSLASSDAQTVTGSNLRNILLLTDRLQVDNMEPSLMDTIKYHQVEDNESWRIWLVMELLDIKHGEWSEDELETSVVFRVFPVLQNKHGAVQTQYINPYYNCY